MVHKCKQLHAQSTKILYSSILRPVTVSLHFSASVHLLFFTKLPATARTRISHITNGRSVSRPLVQSNIYMEAGRDSNSTILIYYHFLQKQGYLSLLLIDINDSLTNFKEKNTVSI